MPTSNAPYYRGLAEAGARCDGESMSKPAMVARVLSVLSAKGAICCSELILSVRSAPASGVTDAIHTLVESGICERLSLSGEDFVVRLTDRGMSLAS